MPRNSPRPLARAVAFMKGPRRPPPGGASATRAGLPAFGAPVVFEMTVNARRCGADVAYRSLDTTRGSTASGRIVVCAGEAEEATTGVVRRHVPILSVGGRGARTDRFRVQRPRRRR